ncbi:hypothetical protein LAC81_07550 [Ensifer adhaerens]|uniref:hypothetical protein n=1 Tax=Ensifer adhaerens TaxID=106592 RepID=UPI001CC04547|nr:hypothetical protein [Ensifer adhaerens]MBZ7921633.1 hypothetical protein [Ensifer adhaerens]UAX94052.1 hypothetical protein LAC78_07545 [Ensifer adhaerens]UAY01686.1 hypothetical protein LAC80_07550 [Ensifer adhaerens]UAY09070.1 hypothetical protein LAC81_07550 [Ensifer adhaerens]
MNEEYGRRVENDTEGGLHFQRLSLNDDPLIRAIASYKRQMALFNRMAMLGGEDLEVLAEKTYRPPLAVIAAWEKPALSREGAMAALKLADEGCRDNDLVITGPMIRAALAYLQKEI